MTPDEVNALVQALMAESQRLGLVWTMRPATITATAGLSATGTYDGDDVEIPLINMVGAGVGERIYVIAIPQGGNYVTGRTGNLSQTGSEVITTSQATGSTVYTDLATIGPTVTRSIGLSGSALVTVTTFVFNGTLGAVNWMGYEVSGATSLAASDDRALALHSMVANGQGRVSVVTHQTGLNPGLNTFTAKYRVNAGNGTYLNRSLIVQPT